MHIQYIDTSYAFDHFKPELQHVFANNGNKTMIHQQGCPSIDVLVSEIAPLQQLHDYLGQESTPSSGPLVVPVTPNGITLNVALPIQRIPLLVFTNTNTVTEVKEALEQLPLLDNFFSYLGALKKGTPAQGYAPEILERLEEVQNTGFVPLYVSIRYSWGFDFAKTLKKGSDTVNMPNNFPGPRFRSTSYKGGHYPGASK